MIGRKTSERRVRKQHNNGFTLVEMVVSFALAAILFASLIRVIAPAYRMYYGARAQADAQLIAGNILDTIRTNAMIATRLTAEGGNVQIGSRKTFYTLNGLLYFNDSVNDVAVYDMEYYNGKSVDLSATQIGENVIKVTVTVSGDEMPSANATAVIAPVRRILGEEGDLAVESELNSAKQVINDNPGATGDTLFHHLYDGPEGNTGFEHKNLFEIIPRARLEALIAQADEQGLTAEKAFFSELLNGTFYIAIFFSGDRPIAYLTTLPSAEQNEANPSYFVYSDGNWYMRNPLRVPDPNCMSSFDGRSAEQIVNYLNEGTDFILAANVQLPLPGV